MAMPQIKGDCLIGQGEACKRAMQMSLMVSRNIIIWLQNACLSGVKLVNVFSVHFRTQVNYSSSYRKRLVVSVTVSICALCLSKRNWKSIVCYYLKFYFQCFPLPFSKWVLARLPDYWSWNFLLLCQFFILSLEWICSLQHSDKFVFSSPFFYISCAHNWMVEFKILICHIANFLGGRRRKNLNLYCSLFCLICWRFSIQKHHI